MKAMDKPRIPDWMRELPDNATIGPVEVAQIYGVCASSVGRCVERGRIPPPAFELKRAIGTRKRWRLGELRKHVKAAAKGAA